MLLREDLPVSRVKAISLLLLLLFCADSSGQISRRVSDLFWRTPKKKSASGLTRTEWLSRKQKQKQLEQASRRTAESESSTTASPLSSKASRKPKLKASSPIDSDSTRVVKPSKQAQTSTSKRPSTLESAARKSIERPPASKSIDAAPNENPSTAGRDELTTDRDEATVGHVAKQRDDNSKEVHRKPNNDIANRIAAIEEDAAQTPALPKSSENESSQETKYIGLEAIVPPELADSIKHSNGDDTRVASPNTNEPKELSSRELHREDSVELTEVPDGKPDPIEVPVARPKRLVLEPVEVPVRKATVRPELARESDSPSNPLRRSHESASGLLESPQGVSSASPHGTHVSASVETRVARLYFYRDTQRVVELINSQPSLGIASETAANGEVIVDLPPPFANVTASMIGQGLIHLRGPLKDINIVRRAIAQIDAPIGQTHIGVHTLQIYGERGDRMDVVAERVHQHLHLSRFLTMRSADLFRQAVYRVVMRTVKKSTGRSTLQPGCDSCYLNEFFGNNFTDELFSLDSTWITGNRLLSLHSVQKTSLASALMITALAKSEKQQEILNEFEAMVQNHLPAAEDHFIKERVVRCRRSVHRGQKSFHKGCQFCADHIRLASRVRFDSLRAFLDDQICLDQNDVLTPVQREFLRLAAIDQRRLVTKLEYNQSVTERTAIEERIGDLEIQDQVALRKERNAKQLFDNQLKNDFALRQKARLSLGKLAVAMKEARNLAEMTRSELQCLDKLPISLRSSEGQSAIWQLDDLQVAARYDAGTDAISYFHRDGQTNLSANGEVNRFFWSAVDAYQNLFDNEIRKYRFAEVRGQKSRAQRILADFQQLRVGEARDPAGYPTNVRKLAHLHASMDHLTQRLIAYSLLVESESQGAIDALDSTGELDELNRWVEMKASINRRIQTGTKESTWANEATAAINILVRELGEVEAANRNAQLTRWPIARKRDLDKVIEQLEDRHIQLLDELRARTTNIDSHIKRIAMALEDDFNRQFYQPTFHCLRDASPYGDVTFGQVETTAVIANNRELAGVSPTATLAFDHAADAGLVTEQISHASPQRFGDAATDTESELFESIFLDERGTSPIATKLVGPEDQSFRNAVGGVAFASPNSACVHCGDAGDGSTVDVALYQFETGTGYVVRPVILPDAQAVSFEFDYVCTTEVRDHEPTAEVTKSQLKQRSIDTNVHLQNYELRPISSYEVALRPAKSSSRAPLLSKIPLAGSLFRPQHPREPSLQKNLVYGQAAIYPSLFDLLDLRWAVELSHSDSLRLPIGSHLLETRVDDFSGGVSDAQDRVLQRRGHLDEVEVLASQETPVRAAPPVPSGMSAEIASTAGAHTE